MENILIKIFPVKTMNIGDDEDDYTLKKHKHTTHLYWLKETIIMHARILWSRYLSFLMLSSE